MLKDAFLKTYMESDFVLIDGVITKHTHEIYEESNVVVEFYMDDDIDTPVFVTRSELESIQFDEQSCVWTVGCYDMHFIKEVDDSFCFDSGTSPIVFIPPSTANNHSNV